jgi:ATP-binding protein involved in chromosome partitioning
MVENMSHFICPDCSGRHEIFGCGGAREKAAALNVPFLGEVPINTQLRISGDEGRMESMLEDEVSGPYLVSLCMNLVRNLVDGRRKKPPMPSLSVLG